ncbi:ATP-binding protein [Desulfovibrio inopinatus]|uniref:ATP-binding protein n=1 Tax=Desulfovibrio inopinatus TaxID=102109 RepID=UPI0004187844|nr:ATP-binding protein [Desulfovibrio inopinatus]
MKTEKDVVRIDLNAEPGTLLATLYRFELTLPIAVVLLIGLGWYVSIHFDKALRNGVVAAYQETQLEIVRAMARSVETAMSEGLARGESVSDLEQTVLARYVQPVHLLEHGDAWIYTPQYVVFDASSDFPQAYRGKSMAEIFKKQEKKGAFHFETMVSKVSKGEEGVGWYVWLPEKGPEIAAWTPVWANGRTWIIGISTPLDEIMVAAGAHRQNQLAIVIMTISTISGLGLAFLSTRNVFRRQRAEEQLRRANAELESRVEERTAELGARTRALLESRIREKEKEKEAGIAFNAGLFESASSYLHNVGNTLSAMDGKFLKINGLIASLEKYGTAVETIRTAHRDALEGKADETEKYLDALRTVLLDRTLPRLQDGMKDMEQLKDRMITTIRHQQDMFSDTQRSQARYVSDIDVGHILRNLIDDFASTLEKRGIVVDIEIEDGLMIRNQKHQFIHGLHNILKNAMEAIDLSEQRENGHIQVKAVKAPIEENRVVIRIADNGMGIHADDLLKVGSSGFSLKPGGHGLGLHAFGNFLNESNGRLKVVSNGLEQGAEFTVEIGDAEGKMIPADASRV